MIIAFWNTNKNKDINRKLVELWKENNLDLLILAEYVDDVDDLIEMLKNEKDNKYLHKCISTGCDRIIVLSKHFGIEPGFQNKYCSIQVISGKFVLCCIHLTSSIYDGAKDDREIEIEDILVQLKQVEKNNELKSVVVGDFNVNPYDEECLKASGHSFNALPTLDDAKKIYRKIKNNSFLTFYNPMWRFFGDYTKPAGTYYYTQAKTKNNFWNIFDQVIIRPELASRFMEDKLEIVLSIGKESLLDEKGHPNKKISDHLPIIFEMR